MSVRWNNQSKLYETFGKTTAAERQYVQAYNNDKKITPEEKAQIFETVRQEAAAELNISPDRIVIWKFDVNESGFDYQWVDGRYDPTKTPVTPPPGVTGSTGTGTVSPGPNLTAPAGYSLYTIQMGDTLEGIARSMLANDARAPTYEEVQAKMQQIITANSQPFAQNGGKAYYPSLAQNPNDIRAFDRLLIPNS